MPLVASALRPLLPVGLLLAGVCVGAGSVLLAYRTEAWAPLVLLAAAGVVVLALTRPIVALHLAIAVVPLELFSFKVGAAGISLSELLFALAGAGWAVNRLAARQAVFVRAPLTWPLATLVLTIVPGLAVAPETYPVVRMLLMWTCFFLIYEMVVADDRRATVRSLLMVLALSAAVVGVIAAVQSGGGTAVELEGLGQTATGRAQGSFGHPNTLATFEGLALPGALILVLAGRPTWRPFALAAFLLTLAGLALSLSRGGLLAVAGALAVMLIWPPFRRAVLIAAGVLALFAFSGVTAFGELQQVQLLSERLSSISYSAAGVDPRFTVWRGTPRIIADHPLIGIGGNTFPEIAPRYGLVLGPAAQDTFEHAHNIPLTIAAELGLVGLAALAWVTFALVRLLLRSYRLAHRHERGLVLAVASAFAALALQGMVDYTLRSNVLVAVIFMLAGAAVVLWRSVDPAAGRPDQALASSR
jgi:O-antigen ligase